MHLMLSVQNSWKWLPKFTPILQNNDHELLKGNTRVSWPKTVESLGTEPLYECLHQEVTKTVDRVMFCA